MNAFLDQLASYLVSEHGKDLQDLCIVLPNLRAGLFLKKYLAGKLGRMSWAPDIRSIEDFLTSLAGLQQVDQVHSLFLLYGIHREIEAEKARDFDDFLRWAPGLLRDFDEADRFLADARQLFSALNETRAISVWNPDNRPLTESEKQYLKFYNSLYNYYSRLVDRLLQKKQAYMGLIYRMAAMGARQQTGTLQWKRVIFAGFNALTRAEEHVMETLAKNDQAEFLWDADRYYLDNHDQEVGEFLRHNLRKWGGTPLRWVSNDIAGKYRQIRITGVPNNAAQAALAGETVAAIASPDERTAVVLPDESLLIPLLNSLPAGLAEMNITMGLPLKMTPPGDLFELIFRMHLNREKFTTVRKHPSPLFYFRDVLSLLKHPLMNQLAMLMLKGNFFAFENMVSSLESGNKVFISPGGLLATGNDLFSAGIGFLQPVFRAWNSPAEAMSAIREFSVSLREALTGNGTAEKIPERTSLDLEYLYAFSKIFYRIERMMNGWPGTVKNLRSLYGLFNLLKDSITLPFSGEPLKGLQIMGMLETRTLDFENLVILSCNEDLLPGSRTHGSFIPLDLKLEFGLPTYRQQDAVQAYHFYRLLQRAVNIHLIYNSEPGELGGGEKSRFIRQIMAELPALNPSAVIKEDLLVMMPESGDVIPSFSVGKDARVMDQIRERAAKGLSPTALNNFRSCGLKFYFSEIAALKEPEETEEEIDNRILGNIVHKTLHELFLPFQGTVLTEQDISLMKAKLDEAVVKACETKFSGRDIRYGKNMLLLGVVKTIVRRFLNSEAVFLRKLSAERTVLVVEELEKKLERTVKIVTSEGQTSVRFKGFADRIDSAGGKIRIIDYKTGRTEKARTRVKDWESLLNNPMPDHAFQLLMYGWMYAPGLEAGKKLEVSVLSLKRLSEGYIPVEVTKDEGRGTKDEGRGTKDEGRRTLDEGDLALFEDVLKKLTSEIFDQTSLFVQTGDFRICRDCSFRKLCGR